VDIRLPEDIDDNPLVKHAEDELRLAGLFDEDADYDGMIGNAVLDLMRVFASQGHSGASAYMTMDLLSKVAAWENITDLTDDPAEWNQVTDDLWQSRRRSDAFSADGGRTYKITGGDALFHAAASGKRSVVSFSGTVESSSGGSID
jgi:hypothetical protein